MKKIHYLYIGIVILFTIYLILNTFVFSKVYQKVKVNESVDIATGDIDSSNTTYSDDHIRITLKTYRQNDTDIYVADIQVDDPSFLKTAFANNSYGKNVVDKTSSIAQNNNAILAINGDYYGVQERGYVLKNGVIYRSSSASNQEDLVIYQDGSFEIINENDTSAEEILKKGAYNILSFGPALVKDSQVSISATAEVDKAMRSNPRTAIGIISENHYVFVVSDGRTSSSEGLSLYELAQFMKTLDCKIAYNLDGGGSSTMYFNGNVINKPTTNGSRVNERSVSDIVYIGY